MGIYVKARPSSRLLMKVILLVLGFSLLAVSGANAVTTDLFMKFKGINGESTEKNHKDWSDILSVKWGVSAEPATPGHGTGAPVFDDLSWTQVMDKSTPALFGKIFSGKIIPTANIDFVGATTHLIYFQMEFKDVFLTSLNLSGDTGKDTTVTGSFAYDSIRLTYTPYDAKGSPLPPVTAKYDLTSEKGSLEDLLTVYALGMAGPAAVVVPIPASLLLFGSGLAGLLGLRRKFHS